MNRLLVGLAAVLAILAAAAGAAAPASANMHTDLVGKA